MATIAPASSSLAASSAAEEDPLYTELDVLFLRARASPALTARELLAARAAERVREKYIIVHTFSRSGRESADVFTAAQWARFTEIVIDADLEVPYHSTSKEAVHWSELDVTIIDDQAIVAVILLHEELLSGNIKKALSVGFFDDKLAKPMKKSAKRTK